MTPNFQFWGAATSEEKRQLSALLELLDYFLMESEYASEAQTLRSTLRSPTTKGNRRANDRAIRKLFAMWKIPFGRATLDAGALNAPYSSLSYVGGGRDAVRVFEFAPPILVVHLDLSFTRETVERELRKAITRYRPDVEKKSQVRAASAKVRTLRDVRDVRELTKRGMTASEIAKKRTWTESNVKKLRRKAKMFTERGALATEVPYLCPQEADRKYNQILLAVARKCLRLLGSDLTVGSPQA